MDYYVELSFGLVEQRLLLQREVDLVERVRFVLVRYYNAAFVQRDCHSAK